MKCQADMPECVRPQRRPPRRWRGLMRAGARLPAARRPAWPSSCEDAQRSGASAAPGTTAPALNAAVRSQRARRAVAAAAARAAPPLGGGQVPSPPRGATDDHHADDAVLARRVTRPKTCPR